MNLCEKCPLLPFKAKTEVKPEIVPGAHYAFIFEAPGKEEIKQRRVLVGPTGKLTMKLLKRFGLTRGTFSLINAVRCVNLKKPTPPMGAIKCCQYFFQQDLKRADPKHVIAFGAKAWAALVGKHQGKIDEVRGKTFEV